MTRNTCSMCGGSGKCSQCAGTGINTHLNQSEPKCSKCSGDGLCPACHGTGRWFVRAPDIQDPGLGKL